MDTVATWLTLLRDGLTTVAALLAVMGISAWRRDFVGKRKIELAEDTLNLFYQARDAIKAMRSPFAFDTESADVTPAEGELKVVLEERKKVQPLFSRYNARSELFAQLHSTRYRFMARFGSEAGKPFEELSHLIHECFVAARMLVSTAADAAFGGDVDGMQERTKQLRAQRGKWEEKIWDMSETDEINVRLNRVVSAMELTCRSIIGRKDLADRLKDWWYRPVGNQPPQKG